MYMPRIFIGGLNPGVNYPNVEHNNELPFFINTDKCNDMIIVDRRYLLENVGFLCSWASSLEKGVSAT